MSGTSTSGYGRGYNIEGAGFSKVDHAQIDQLTEITGRISFGDKVLPEVHDVGFVHESNSYIFTYESWDGLPPTAQRPRKRTITITGEDEITEFCIANNISLPTQDD